MTLTSVAKISPTAVRRGGIGELRYRVMIECKLSRDHNVAHTNAAVEAGKYRDVYQGAYCVLVALSFLAEATFSSELHTHGVAA